MWLCNPGTPGPIHFPVPRVFFWQFLRDLCGRNSAPNSLGRGFRPSSVLRKTMSGAGSPVARDVLEAHLLFFWGSNRGFWFGGNHGRRFAPPTFIRRQQWDARPPNQKPRLLPQKKSKWASRTSRATGLPAPDIVFRRTELGRNPRPSEFGARAPSGGGPGYRAGAGNRENVKFRPKFTCTHVCFTSFTARFPD